MTAPVLKVELAFGSTWQTAPGSRTWTDVTQYVLQGKVGWNRGASAARGQVDTGRVSLAFTNADRRFDPTHTTGPYYANLKPGVPVRVTGTPAGQSASVQFVGHVVTWPNRYDIGNTFSWVPVTGFDGFAVLARATAPQGVLMKAIEALAPDAYWMLEDPNESTSAADQVGQLHGVRHGEPVFGSDVLAPGLGGSCEFDGSDRLDITRSLVVSDVRQATVVAVVRTVSGVNRQAIWAQRGAQMVLYLFVDEDGFPALEWIWAQTGLTAAVVKGVGVVNDGTTHLVIGQANSGGTDGGVGNDTDTLSTTSTNGLGSFGGNGVAIGGPPNKSGGSGYFNGWLSHVAVWDRALSDAERATLPTAYNALDGQTGDLRIGYLLDEIGWPAALRDLETCRSVLGPATFRPGDNVLTYMRSVAASEDGRLFITKDGKVRILDRYWPFLESTVSAFTFTDQNAANGYADFELDLDDDLLVNQARLSRRGGGEQVITDQTSVNTYGTAELTVTDLLHTTDNETRSLGEWLVASRSTPLPRVPKIRVPLHRYSAADQTTVLGLELGDRVTVARTPQGVGTAISLAFLVDGVRHDVGGGEWWVELFVSPVPQESMSLFVWGTSEWGGTDVWAY